MDYFTIIKWKDNIEYLKDYDCVGTNWQIDTFLGKKPHFSGNCWWATSKHINDLNHEYLTTPSIYDREFWIGSTYFTKSPKVKNLFDSGLNKINHAGHNDQMYPEDNYVFDYL